MESTDAVAALGALAQDSRLAVFRLLVQAGPEGLAASEVAARLGIPSATLSFHLKALSHAGLVADRRDKWSKQQAAPGVTLAYARGTGSEVNLLKSAEAGPWSVFTVPNSLREVEVGSNLLLREDDPSDDPGAAFLPPPVASEADIDEVPQAAGDADPVDDAEAALEPDEVVL